MIYDRHETQAIAITMGDGSLTVMRFITRAWSGKGARDSADAFSRGATDEAINLEIERSEFPQPVVSWRRIDPADLPASRDNRNAWRDEGNRIVVDPARIATKPKTIEERIAALEALQVPLKR